jgi:PKD repeat protein
MEGDRYHKKELHDLIIWFALLLLFFGANSWATTIGPDAAGYVGTDAAYNFEDISGTGTLLSNMSSHDDATESISIGFGFDFYGTSYTSLWVSSNGLLNFTSSASHCCSGIALPATSVTEAVIGGWWEDLNTSTSGDVYSQLLGSYPNRRLIVQFHNVAHHGGGNNVTFQFKLFESTNSIEVHFHTILSDGGNHSVGIQAANGTAGLSWYYGTGTVSNGSAVRFAKTVSLPLNLIDGESYLWDIQQNGSILDGTSDAYDGGLVLSGFPGFATGLLEQDRQISIGPATISGLEVTRKIYVPAGAGFARFMEVLHNPGASAVTQSITLDTNLGSDSGTQLISTSSGDQTFTTDDDWLVTDDSDGTGDPSMTHVFAGTGGTLRPSSVPYSVGAFSYTFDVTLQPGETKILLHFAAQSVNQADALTKAQSLVTLSGDALTLLDAEEIGQIVNFPTQSLPLTLNDGEGFHWDIQQNGNILDGTSDAYDGGLVLSGFPVFGTGALEQDRQLHIGPATINGLEVTRKIYVPTEAGFARFMEVLHNPGGSAVSQSVTLATDLGSDSGTQLISTSSGDQSFTTDDDWLVTDDSDGTGDPSMTHVFAGAGGILRPSSITYPIGTFSYTFDLTLQPGETKIILHFAAQSVNQAEALAKAQSLVTLPPDALVLIDEQATSQIVNFFMGLPTAPIADAGGNLSATEGSSVAFFGTFTDPNEGDTHTISWNFGDETSTAGTLTPTHTYVDDGEYLVTLTVIDSSGLSDSDTVTVTVSNVAPVANAGADQTVNEGAIVSFTGSATDVGSTDTLSYAWVFGDGGAAQGEEVTHSYQDEGVFTAILTVSDGDGGSHSDNQTVTVQNVAPVASVGADINANEGASIQFSGSATDAGTTDTLSYSWTFGDGSSGSGTNPSHSYADNGVYTVTLTVSDGDGGSDSASQTVTVANVNPIANAGADATAEEGASVTFAGSASDAGSADILSYSWDFGDGTQGSGPSPTHSYADNGSYTATLTVTDDDGASHSDDRLMTITNANPIASAGEDQEVNEGDNVTFSGSGSDAGSADTLSYAWVFGDGSEAQGANVSHIYVDNGVFTATLTVTDDDGGSHSDNQTVTVLNIDPIADAGADQIVNEGAIVSFTGSATDVGSADSLSYSWNFGDGNVAQGAEVTHSYQDEGLFTAILTVSDGDGGSHSDNQTVTVQNVAPVASLGGDINASEGQTIQFAGSATDAGTTDTLSYSWTFGDGSSGSGTNPSHSYADNGVYTVTLIVSDGDGGSDSASQTVTVANVNPVANAGADATAEEGASVAFAGSASDAGSADILTYSWYFGDGTQGSGPSPTHSYADNGSYTAILTVSDDDGGSHSDSRAITITNVAPTAYAGEDQTAEEGANIPFTAIVSDPGSADTHSYEWDFGDGSPLATSAQASHRYADNGSYTATLTVTDDDGASHSDERILTITNANPLANAGEDQEVNEGDNVTFSGSGSDAGSADTLSYAWVFGDGSEAEGANVSHIYVDNGVFTATLTVTDDDGGSHSDNQTVTVLNVDPVANAGQDQSGNEGEVLSFTGTATDVGIEDTLTYSWAFGDGASANGQSVNHSYRDNGVFTAILTVTDDDGGSHSDNQTVAIANVDPVANAGSDQAANEGDSVTFSGSLTDAGADDTHTYVWRFGDGASASGLSVTHRYADNGVFTAILTVTDDDGGSHSDDQTVTISNVNPVASAGDDQQVNEGDEVSFAGTATDAGSADTLTYVWIFGDGTSALGQNVTHTYGNDGVYTATLRVSDDDGGRHEDTLTVSVASVAPVGDAGEDQTVNEGEQVAFTGAASDGGSGDKHRYVWDFGDGTSANGRNVNHTYPDDGIFTVTMTVTDSDDQVSTDTLVVTVLNVAPVAEAGENQATNEGSSVSFIGSASDVGVEDTFSYAWSFGDNETAEGASVSHTYADDGEYTVTLSVTDDDGGVGTDNQTVIVTNVAPAVAVDPAILYAGSSTVGFKGEFSDPGSADSHSLEWSFGDGVTASGELEITHAFGSSGLFDVTLSVTDDDGGEGSAWLSIRTWTLTVTVGNGGSVTSGMSGIACESDCSESYPEGTQVTLTATPEIGYLFDGWSGACSGTAGCTLTMNDDLAVGALFASDSMPCWTTAAPLTATDYASRKSEVSIESGGIVELLDTDLVEYRAPVIRFLPDFHVLAGSSLSAKAGAVSCE